MDIGAYLAFLGVFWWAGWLAFVAWPQVIIGTGAYVLASLMALTMAYRNAHDWVSGSRDVLALSRLFQFGAMISAWYYHGFGPMLISMFAMLGCTMTAQTLINVASIPFARRLERRLNPVDRS